MSRETTWSDEGGASAAETVFAPDPADLKAAEAAVEEEWKVGDVILDLYEVKGVLGEGGFGKVYRVLHRNWNLDLAVKTPRADKLTERVKKSFIREAETWVNLGLHPHIVSCYYVRDLGGLPRVFAECVEGGSLLDWIAKARLYEGGHGPALERMLDIAIQFAWGLHFAHEKGLVHQDVKPANVMITESGLVKVTDFGIARARDVSGAKNESLGTILVKREGMTEQYASPEQAAGKPLSRKTDIWSWALSVFAMFDGEMGWPSGVAGAELLEVCLEHGIENPRIPSIPQGLARLLRGCFSHEPADRPESMLAIANHLQNVYEIETGQDYSRELPKEAEALADSLNNRAVSMMDLGRTDLALQSWDKALNAQSGHAESTYNRGLVLWRSAQVDDADLLSQLTRVKVSDSEPWKKNYLKSLIHLENNDLRTAITLLREVEVGAPSEILTLLEQTQNNLSRAHEYAGFKDYDVSPVKLIKFNADGRYLAYVTPDNTLQIWNVETCTSVSLGIPSNPFQNKKRWIRGKVQIRTVLLFHLSEKLIYLFLRLPNLAKTLVGRFVDSANIPSVQFSPDGKVLAFSDERADLHLFDVTSSRYLHHLRGHQIHFTSGGHVASVSNQEIKVWDTITGKCLQSFQVYTDKVRFSPGGSYAVCGYYSGRHNDRSEVWSLKEGRSLFRFGSWQSKVEISPDDSYLAYETNVTEYHIKLVRLGDPERAIYISTGGPTSFGFSPDSRFLAVKKEGKNELNIFSAATGESLSTLRPSEHDTRSAVNPWYFRSLATKLFLDTKTVEWLYFLMFSSQNVRFSPDRQQFVSLEYSGIGDGNVVKLYDTRTNRCQRTFQSSVSSKYKDTEFSPDGQLIVFSLEESLKGVYQIKKSASSPMLLSRVSSSEAVLEVDESFREKMLLARRAFESHDYTSALRYVRQARQLPNHEYRAEAVELWTKLYSKLSRRSLNKIWQFSKAEQPSQLEKIDLCLGSIGHYLLCGRNGQNVEVWDLNNGDQVCTIQEPCEHINSIKLSSDGRHVAITGGSQSYEIRRDPSLHATISVWNIESNQLWETFRVLDYGLFAFSPDGQYFAFGTEGEAIELWNLSEGTLCYRFASPNTFYVKNIRFSPDGKYLACNSGSEDGVIIIWDTTTGKCLQNFKNLAYLEFAFSPNSRHFACDNRNTVEVWHVGFNECLQTFEGHNNRPSFFRFSSNGRYLASHSNDEDIKIWDLYSGRSVHNFQGYRFDLLQFHPVRPYVVGSIGAERIEMWDLVTGSCVVVYDGHQSGIASLTFNPDGRHIISSGSFDNKMKVWEVESGKLLFELEGHEGPVTYMNFSPNGDYLLSWSSEGIFKESAILWLLDWSLEQCEPTDWDESARPYLENFLTLHSDFVQATAFGIDPVKARMIPPSDRANTPEWNQADLEALMHQLASAGLSHIRPEGVVRELERMMAADSANWAAS